RGAGEGGLDARLRGGGRRRRGDRHAGAGDERGALLPQRVVRQVRAVPAGDAAGGGSAGACTVRAGGPPRAGRAAGTGRDVALDVDLRPGAGGAEPDPVGDEALAGRVGWPTRGVWPGLSPCHPRSPLGSFDMTWTGKPKGPESTPERASQVWK